MAKGKAVRRAARPDDLVTLTRDARDYLDELDRRAKEVRQDLDRGLPVDLETPPRRARSA